MCFQGFTGPATVFSENHGRHRHKLLWAVLLPCLIVSGTLSAQSTKFQAERDRLTDEAAAEANARGFGQEDPRFMDYLPAILRPVSIQKVVPGESVSVSLAGTIPPGVTVLSDRDGAVLSGATLSGTGYSARLSAAPAEVPGFVRLWAFTPVSASSANVPVAFIDANWRFDLAADGLTIKVFPAEKTFRLEDEMNASLAYRAEFYKPGETTPFATRDGAMNYSVGDEPRLRLDISLWEQKSSPQAEMEELSARLADPNLSDADRDALGERLAAAQQRMVEDLMKDMNTDPAVLNKQQDDFGCRLVQVYPETGYAVRATVLCGANFYDGVLQTTGTMTLVH
jgi:hypothetical protein